MTLRDIRPCPKTREAEGRPGHPVLESCLSPDYIPSPQPINLLCGLDLPHKRCDIMVDIKGLHLAFIPLTPSLAVVRCAWPCVVVVRCGCVCACVCCSCTCAAHACGAVLLAHVLVLTIYATALVAGRFGGLPLRWLSGRFGG